MTPKSSLTDRATQTDRIFKEIVGKERAAQDAKTARLKALRLAQAAESNDAAPPAPVALAKPKKAIRRVSAK